MGYFFAIRYRQGKNINLWFEKILGTVFSWFRYHKKKRMKVTYKRPESDLEYNAKIVENQKEIDRILDKISGKGYESLSAEEKATLFKSGKR